MRSILLFLFVCVCCRRAAGAYNCTACEKRTCPQYLTPCGVHHVTDPCGCCESCAKQKWDVCGGPDWELGYCDRDLQCANITGVQLVDTPNIGVCKQLPGYSRKEYFEDDDENCPERTGCYRVMGTCDCPTKRTCILDFTYDSYNPLYCDPQFDDPSFEHLFTYKCTKSGCDLVDNQCVCSSGGCDRTFQFQDKRQCYKVMMETRCSNVTCLEPKVPTCPRDSALSRPHTPYGSCCPSVPSYCTCNFEQCTKSCPNGKRLVIAQKTDGKPGSCCDKFLCLL